MTQIKDNRFQHSLLPCVKKLDLIDEAEQLWASQKKVSVVLMLFIDQTAHQANALCSCAILTKRSLSVKSHKGQICLPGGKKDPADSHVIDTALREAHEEISANPNDIKIHGALPSVKTPTGDCVIPLVGTSIQSFDDLKPNCEVAQIIAVPAKTLTPQSNCPFTFTIFGKKRSSDLFQFDRHMIWGLTARIIVNSEIIPSMK